MTHPSDDHSDARPWAPPAESDPREDRDGSASQPGPPDGSDEPDGVDQPAGPAAPQYPIGPPPGGWTAPPSESAWAGAFTAQRADAVPPAGLPEPPVDHADGEEPTADEATTQRDYLPPVTNVGAGPGGAGPGGAGPDQFAAPTFYGDPAPTDDQRDESASWGPSENGYGSESPQSSAAHPAPSWQPAESPPAGYGQPEPQWQPEEQWHPAPWSPAGPASPAGDQDGDVPTSQWPAAQPSQPAADREWAQPGPPSDERTGPPAGSAHQSETAEQQPSTAGQQPFPTGQQPSIAGPGTAPPPGAYQPGAHQPGAYPAQHAPGPQQPQYQSGGYQQPVYQQPGHQQPGQQQPPHLQQHQPPGGPPSTPRPEALLRPTQADDGRGVAATGWRGRVNRISGGVIKPQPNAQEQGDRRAQQDIQRPFARPMTVVVVQPKGGAGKTPTTIGLASALGAHRGGYVVGWDDNETRGTLAVRVRNTSNQTTTVWDLLGDLSRFETNQARVGDLSNYVRSQGAAQFDALVSDESPDNMDQIGAEEFRRIHEVLQRFYRLIVVDTGNNVRSKNWQAAINAADLVVVVSTYRRDVGFSGSWVLDHLTKTGREADARGAVTVLTASDPTTDPQVRSELLAHFGQRTRDVVEIPYDPLIALGGPMEWAQMRPATRAAWTRAGAAVVNALGEVEQRGPRRT